MKKMFAMAAAILLAAALPVSAEAVSAQKAILVDGNTGRVLYEKNAERQTADKGSR